ncbi:actin interacting protein 3-domain-containing protein [Gigaspora rosea]|uniref:Actin interacting protein 3-domain-containing protein n=1 Tax=Gigaspora rosea TaxID=44941 RepID=A0A397TUZ9_9GLOM|nr:actin interacting protein 3-domain-containing protein [Gigaspora rosea]
MESTITQLLVTTKSLLEALTAWSTGRVTEQQVSDIYVKLAIELNQVVHLFGQAGLDTSNMVNIPQDLKGCLENALCEEASPSSLDNHLPKIKEIIVNLLQALKTKQSIYRQTQNNYESNSPQPTSPVSGPQSIFSMNQNPPPPSSNSSDNSNSNNGSSSMDPVAALKRDNLERRASRRFSAWGGKKPNLRRSSKKLNSVQPPELNIPEEVENVQEGTTLKPNGSAITSPIISPIEPILLNKNNKPSLDKHNEKDDVKDSNKKFIILYLQLGKDVKKIRYDGDINMTALQMLFIEKFQYNPGMENFPNIYIKDPQIGILYELEDLSEVKDKSVLALNVEDLQQVKKHIDESIAGLTKEIQDLKKSFAESTEVLRHGNITTPAIPAIQTFVPNKQPSTSSTDDDDSISKNDKKLDKSKDNLVNKITGDLKNHFHEVQNLRRDLGSMRQIYSEFQGETKKLFESLAAQTESVKQVALTNVGSSRSFIDSGKAKLDSRSTALLKKVDDLQDIIDRMKSDVVKRGAKPQPTEIQHVKQESMAVAKELSSLQEYVKTVKPTWKQTWKQELQMIVDEQQFLNHQEELLEDLQEDHKKLTEVFNTILKVIKTPNSTKVYVPPAAEEGFEGLKTVLQEVRGIAPDHERRLKALQAVEKQRERDLANRIDEFEAELTDFVSHNKLKKTGGAQEVERLRQKKNEEALKELYKSEKNESS